MSFWSWLTSAFGGRSEDAPVPEPHEPPEPRETTPYRTATPPATEPPKNEPPKKEPAKKERRPTPPAILGATFDHHEGGIAGATPIADVWIQGVPCAARTSVGFHRNGRLSVAVLARAHEIEGEMLPAGAQVGFETDGKLSAWVATRAEDFATRVLDMKKEWLPITIPAGSQITMEHGQLRSVRLAGALGFDDLSFPAETELIFGDSGSLSHVTCREAIELRGVRWAKHETVVFEFGCLREGYPDGEGTVDGVPYEAGEIVRLHDNGRLARCYLADDTELSGVPCKGNTRIYRDDEGHLLEGTLAIDTMIAGVPVAEDSVVALTEGKPTALTPREDVEIDGLLCASGQLIELTTEGRLVRATLARDEVRDGWRLPAGSIVVFASAKLELLVVTGARAPDDRVLEGMWRVDLAEDGTIQMLLPVTSMSVAGSLTLRTATTISGLGAAKGSNVRLDDDGKLASLVLANDQRVGPYTAKGGTRVHLRPDGTPSNLYLVEDTRIDGIPCAGARTLGAVMNDVEHSYREEVRLDENGAVRWAILAEDATVSGVPLAHGNTVARWPNGVLHVGTLASRWTHSLGFVAREKTLVGCFDDGSPSLVTLAEPFTLAGTEYPAGAVLKFESPGVLASVDSAQVPLGPCDPIDATP